MTRATERIGPDHLGLLLRKVATHLEAAGDADDTDDQRAEISQAQDTVSDLRKAVLPGATTADVSPVSLDWMKDVLAPPADAPRRRFALIDHRDKRVGTADTPEEIGRFVMDATRDGEMYRVQQLPLLTRPEDNRLIDAIDTVASALSRLSEEWELAECSRPELAVLLAERYPFHCDLTEVALGAHHWLHDLTGI